VTGASLIDSVVSPPGTGSLLSFCAHSGSEVTGSVEVSGIPNASQRARIDFEQLPSGESPDDDGGIEFELVVVKIPFIDERMPNKLERFGAFKPEWQDMQDESTEFCTSAALIVADGENDTIGAFADLNGRFCT
jgi:hypothetical protein